MTTVKEIKDLKNLNPSPKKVFVEETWTIWIYDYGYSLWANTGMA